MFVTSAASFMLLAAAIAAPQDAVKKSSEQTPDLTRMHASVKALKAADGYRFSAKVTLEPVMWNAKAEGIFDTTQAVPAMKDLKPTTIEFDGTFAKSMPLHLEGQEVDAYRDGTDLTFTDKKGMWQLQTTAPPMPGHADQVPGSKGDRTEEDMRACELWALYSIPAPHELLGHLDIPKANFQRAVDAGGLFSADDYVYTTTLEGKAIPACCVSVLGSADQLVCTLRIVTDSKGEIQRVELQGTQMDTAKAVGSKIGSKLGGELGSRDLSISYKLKDIGDDIEVKLPQAAQLRLKS